MLKDSISVEIEWNYLGAWAAPPFSKGYQENMFIMGHG